MNQNQRDLLSEYEKRVERIMSNSLKGRTDPRTGGEEIVGLQLCLQAARVNPLFIMWSHLKGVNRATVKYLRQSFSPKAEP